jgi:hypothetical protein
MHIFKKDSFYNKLKTNYLELLSFLEKRNLNNETFNAKIKPLRIIKKSSLKKPINRFNFFELKSKKSRVSVIFTHVYIKILDFIFSYKVFLIYLFLIVLLLYNKTFVFSWQNFYFFSHVYDLEDFIKYLKSLIF